MTYIGRFAPSPSGPLHFGSLVAALASFCDAKAHQGQWLVRMEDIDPPREMPKAKQIILQQLEGFGLHWDGQVLYQSQRLDLYQQQIDTWLSLHQAYACRCTRKRLKTIQHIYDGYCSDKNLPTENSAIRFVNTSQQTEFTDLIYGKCAFAAQHCQQDFIIKRKDGLIAYQLAVCLDDVTQGINHVVRGYDLIDTTIWQHTLIKQLGGTPPNYAHVPLAFAEDGRKLSKQNGASAIDIKQAPQLLVHALEHLGLQPPKLLHKESVEQIILWAIEHWQRQKVQNVAVKPPNSV
ncbi:glutamyl-tRNA synthetase [Catenovulum agarivorans DS-2]|uniref:Glutamyl-Q tRNA(Asp) synthetase n=1 Tax=Catenovulum agarivorans DS-2 TaxID=1328313 RepID=W7QYA4_9ALTE|nr:tRNA glutamyl-Q(34) synthetase GluQRS [Catenovulum agarivorans]EWH10295.1 glutamyl-tRNA synthetase [Catenovulum agarivorans DS-2]